MCQVFVVFRIEKEPLDGWHVVVVGQVGKGGSDDLVMIRCLGVETIPSSPGSCCLSALILVVCRVVRTCEPVCACIHMKIVGCFRADVDDNLFHQLRSQSSLASSIPHCPTSAFTSQLPYPDNAQTTRGVLLRRRICRSSCEPPHARPPRIQLIDLRRALGR